MALKDWKKTYEDKKYQEYTFKNSDDNRTVSVRKGILVTAFQKDFNKGWRFQLQIMDPWEVRYENFKTAKKALAYAKSYMRKH